MRIVCIGEYGLGNSVYCVEEPIASKMLEVYDRAQSFEPVVIDDGLTVQADKSTKWPVVLLVHRRHKMLSIEESRQLRTALESAEKYAESHS